MIAHLVDDKNQSAGKLKRSCLDQAWDLVNNRRVEHGPLSRGLIQTLVLSQGGEPQLLVTWDPHYERG